ncbi:MAG: sigma-70 family RNA polymerase sigma factor [Anaerohalosphaeraceae bacterium]
MDQTENTNNGQILSRYEEFLNLFRTNEDRIFGFILTFLPNFAKAEDILQETMIIMWRKFDEFESGTNFAAWGIKIARYNLYKFHENHQAGVVRFDSDAIEAISQQVGDMDTRKTNSYIDALLHCFEKLGSQGRQLMLLKYEQNFKVQEISEKIGRSIRDTYRILSRIQHTLHECTSQTLKAWEL